MEREASTRLTPAGGRKFAFTLMTAFFLFGAGACYGGHRLTVVIFGCCGAVSLAAGLLVPGRLTHIWRAWMKLSYAISKVTTPLIMGIVYFLVFLPIGLLKRWLGRNALAHKLGSDGYWVVRSRIKSIQGDLERQF